MASLVLSGDTSGSITLAAPAVAGSTTQTLVANTGTLAPIVSGTSQTAPFTDNTRAEFTSIPSWAKRITLMISNVSTNGTSLVQVQIGSGSYSTSGYVYYGAYAGAANQAGGASYTSGFVLDAGAGGGAGYIRYGVLTLALITGNTWAGTYVGGFNTAGTTYSDLGAGSIALGGVLDRVRLITVNGTDTFDTSSIVNILYE